MDAGDGSAAQQARAGVEVGAAWEDLRSELETQLSRMTTDEDHFLLEMPEGNGDGCTPYAQFAGFGAGTMVRAEPSGNAYLAAAYELGAEDCEMLQTMGWSGNDDTSPNWFIECPIGLPGVAAAMVVGALRDIWAVGHPQLLTYAAFGPTPDNARSLGLSATEDVPVEPPAQPLALMPSRRDELVELVGTTLLGHFGEAQPLESDGDFVIAHLGQPVWVRVRDDQPAVEILARVTHGVHSRRATAAEIAVLNRTHMWTQWVLREREVWMRLPMPARPFVPAHLTSMLDIFFDAMTKTRDDLAFRVGGKVA